MRLLMGSGGLAFAASLASVGYVLAVSWPGAAPLPRADLPAALLWNAALFALFAAHHSLFARTRVKQRLQPIAPLLAHRSVYVWVASALLALTVLGWRPVGHRLWPPDGIWRLSAIAAQGAGIVLMLLAGRIIDPLELAGVHAATNTRLDARGPYLLVRHPIYLGALLILWATPAMTGDRFVFAALATVYFAVAVPWEEASMRGALGEAYDRYRARVRWRVIPGLF
jgi:protein-S-isoprenylcysteine O-methyltransferase Ste14